ncbi:hypothetical protein LOTGIDRAFT_132197 [Lottia gigantea]|uniref:UBX domain-containing protein n=1 Tax=Lottia gigantea TaxID=225164 RepID=V3Z1P7_LOTGI|nr:hypothetical protein LOTGIDRAFT_132197 [Lottia gigantea]ESO84463.1 hypothetical protein LOTGIDRAFT_132197 [Lottia gigantea]
MADEEDLNPQQTEKLIQFQDLTGMENIERCREILQRHSWNLETAVQDTFNEREGAPTVFNQPTPEPRVPALNLQPRGQRVFTVGRQPPQGIMQWGYFIILFPFRFVYSTFYDILLFVYRLLRPDPRRNVTDPIGDVVRFIEKFNQTYGPTHPVFYQGTYSQALTDAKKELKFLLVYLHGDNHQDTDTFCRSTLCNTDVIEFLNSRLLFWSCNTNSPEGYRVSQALRENTYPFLALIVLRESKMSVVARIEGPIGPEELVQRLERVMSDNETSLAVARADREERSFNQTLRQQQDEAYLESLRADQEKERKKREEREQLERQEMEELEANNERLRSLEEKDRRKEEMRSQLPNEPDDDSNSIRLLLKTPSGKRIERKFHKSDSMKHLHDYVFCHEECPDDFQIVTNFPRRTLPCAPSENNPNPPSFEEFGLGKTEMLFVHDNEA